MRENTGDTVKEVILTDVVDKYEGNWYVSNDSLKKYYVDENLRWSYGKNITTEVIILFLL